MNYHDERQKNKIFFGFREVIEIKEISLNTYILEVSSSPELANAAPGQFVYIMPKVQKKILLPRPLCIVDVDGNSLKMIFKVKGRGTGYLAEVRKGENLSLMGPLGKGFETITAPSVLVGGGLGVSPLYLLAKKLNSEFGDKGIKAIIGFKNKAEAFYIEKFSSLMSNVLVCSDDGSLGEKGNVVEILEKNLNGEKVVYACGPRPMLKAVSDFTLGKDVKLFVSLEERMGCGMGACLGCVVKIKTENGEEYRRVCKEGPVFDGHKVIY